MPRRLRVEYAGAVYHVMARGNNRQEIFGNDAMRSRFLDTLGEACAQTGWIVHAYVLMQTHYHLLLETPEANLVSGMKWLQGTYTQRFNLGQRRTGHLFQGRYKSLVIDPEDPSRFQTVSTYIHLNPFRAKCCGTGFARRLESYRWSSYPSYLRPRRQRPGWLDTGRVMESVGIVGTGKRDRERYRDWLERRMAYERDPVNAEVVGEAYRTLRRGWCLGSRRFRQDLLELMGNAQSDNLRGEQRREHGEHAAELLLRRGMAALGLTEAEVRARKSTDLEKQALAWLLKKHTTVTGMWVAERLSMGHRVNASRAISRFDRGGERKVKGLKEKMLQCTGFSEKPCQAPKR